MTEAQELMAAVRARTEGTPYVVSETDHGFDVRVDIEDASWYALLYKQHLSRTWIYHVRLQEGSKELSITDDARDVDWRAGAESRDGVPTPVLSASRSGAKGRFQSTGFQKTWGVDEQGDAGLVVDYRFTSSEGRDLIRGPARELGWTEKRGGAERIGLYVGVGTIVLLVLAGIIVAVVALAGGF